MLINASKCFRTCLGFWILQKVSKVFVFPCFQKFLNCWFFIYFKSSLNDRNMFQLDDLHILRKIWFQLKLSCIAKNIYIHIYIYISNICCRNYFWSLKVQLEKPKHDLCKNIHTTLGGGNGVKCLIG